MMKFKKYIWLVLCSTVLLVAGCGVNQKQVETATELCKEHGGLKLLWGTVMGRSVDVICIDGVEIEKEIDTGN